MVVEEAGGYLSFLITVDTEGLERRPQGGQKDVQSLGMGLPRTRAPVRTHAQFSKSGHLCDGAAHGVTKTRCTAEKLKACCCLQYGSKVVGGKGVVVWTVGPVWIENEQSVYVRGARGWICKDEAVKPPYGLDARQADRLHPETLL